jgi:two-component system NarL family response regulator
MIDIILTDDHNLFREGLSRIIEEAPGIALVATASSGEEALQLVAKHRPDLVLMDINMPGMGGLEATRILRQRYPKIQVLMLTISEEDQDLLTAVRFGARGYILKNSSSRELLDGIHRVNAGEAVITPSMAVKLLEAFAATPPQKLTELGTDEPAEKLTEREAEVLSLIAQGLNNQAIGEQLSISPNTVKAHLRNILDKLELGNRVEAATWALRHGLAGEK